MAIFITGGTRGELTRFKKKIFYFEAGTEREISNRNWAAWSPSHGYSDWATTAIPAEGRTM